MQTIDIADWKRREHFEFFRKMDRPQYDVCAPVDVTGFYDFVKSRNLSFYYSMVYAAVRAASSVEALRYRIRGDDVVLHDRLHASFTELKPGKDYFSIVACDLRGTLEDFLADAAAKVATQDVFMAYDDYAGRDDFVFMTCLPWISFTQVSNAYNLDKNDAVPRFAWGKYTRQNGRLSMPFSVQVHHAFVDGFHVGQFFAELQKTLDNMDR